MEPKELLTALPSKFQIDDKVNVCYGLAGILKNGFVQAVRFSQENDYLKEFYDIVIQISTDEFTLLENISEEFIELSKTKKLY